MSKFLVAEALSIPVAERTIDERVDRAAVLTGATETRFAVVKSHNFAKHVNDRL